MNVCCFRKEKRSSASLETICVHQLSGAGSFVSCLPRLHLSDHLPGSLSVITSMAALLIQLHRSAQMKMMKTCGNGSGEHLKHRPVP